MLYIWSHCSNGAKFEVILNTSSVLYSLQFISYVMVVTCLSCLLLLMFLLCTHLDFLVSPRYSQRFYLTHQHHNLLVTGHFCKIHCITLQETPSTSPHWVCIWIHSHWSPESFTQDSHFTHTETDRHMSVFLHRGILCVIKKPVHRDVSQPLKEIMVSEHSSFLWGFISCSCFRVLTVWRAKLSINTS